jgi:hypothetical protein
VLVVIAILLIFGWRDGPIAGVVRQPEGTRCWYFRLIAERLETEELDDRLFGLTEIPSADSAALIEAFGNEPPGTHVWPPAEGIGSPDAINIVERMLTGEPGRPSLIIRTTDFVSVEGVWNTVDHQSW